MLNGVQNYQIACQYCVTLAMGDRKGLTAKKVWTDLKMKFDDD